MWGAIASAISPILGMLGIGGSGSSGGGGGGQYVPPPPPPPVDTGTDPVDFDDYSMFVFVGMSGIFLLVLGAVLIKGVK